MFTPRRRPASTAGRSTRCTYHAVLASMRIESRKSESGRSNAESRQFTGRQVDDVVEKLARQHARNVRERHVNGGEHNLQRLRPEHHRDTAGARQMREQIRVPFP
jgi:hypothetical protein